MRLDYIGAADMAHEGTSILSMDIFSILSIGKMC